MGELRLYTDEDSGRSALITGLRARGFDVLSTNDAGRSGEDDRSQLEFSTQQGRAIYTFNVGDFARLHVEFLATGQHHGRVIAVPRQRYSVGEQIKRLSSFLLSTSAEEMVNRMEYL